MTRLQLATITDVNNKINESTVLKKLTLSQWNTLINEQPNYTGLVYIIEKGKMLDVINGIAVEQVQKESTLRPTESSSVGNIYVDDVGKVVYKYTSDKYWEVIIKKYINGYLNMQYTAEGIIRHYFNTVEGSNEKDTWSIQYNDTNNKITSWLTSTRNWQHVKIIFNNKNDTENITKKQDFISAQSMSLPDITQDGVEGEMQITCQKSKLTGMAFGYRFVKYFNNFFILDKWYIDTERQNSYPLNCSFTNLAERTGNTITPPDYLREYWDIGLKQMLLIDSNGVWRSFDQKLENITFPTNPTQDQEFTSTLGDVYKYDNNNKYWKLQLPMNEVATTVKDYIMVSKTGNYNMGYSAGNRWGVDLIVNQIGTGLALDSSGIRLKANTTYKLSANLSFYTNDTSGQFMTFGFYNATKSTWIKGSMATIWGSSWNYQPNRSIEAIYTTGSTNEIIDIRNGYSGFTSTAQISIVGMNSLGNPTNGNGGGTSYFTAEAIDTYQQKLIPQEGTYADYLYATLATENQTITANNTDILLSYNLKNIGEVTNTNGVFRLKAGKNYELFGVIGGNVTTTSNYSWNWVDSSGNILEGASAGSVMPGSTTWSMTQTAYCNITPSVDMDVKLRITYFSSGTFNIYRTTKITSLGTSGNGSNGGGSYCIIRQLGSSKVYAEKKFIYEGTELNNYTVRANYTDSYSPNKVFTDTFWHSSATNLTASEVALKVGDTVVEKNIQFWYLYQKLASFIVGADNDSVFDGSMVALVQEANKDTKSMITGNLGIPLTTSVGDIDQSDNATAVPTEMYKMILGRDKNNNIWWVNVSPTYYNGSSTTPASLVNGFCLKYEGSDGNWTTGGSTTAPMLRSATAFVSSGTPDKTNNILNGSYTACQLMPIRLTLA